MKAIESTFLELFVLHTTKMQAEGGGAPPAKFSFKRTYLKGPKNGKNMTNILTLFERTYRENLSKDLNWHFERTLNRFG
jgi:hypothetical protein